MGLFQQRPEEPTEWAGLPSDPWEPRSPVESLPDTPDAMVPTIGTATVSIEIPIPFLPVADGDGD